MRRHGGAQDQPDAVAGCRKSASCLPTRCRRPFWFGLTGWSLHRKYRRYVRRTSQFMAHDEMGSTIGDKVRIVETRPLSARKRWRVVEILQKAAK